MTSGQAVSAHFSNRHSRNRCTMQIRPRFRLKTPGYKLPSLKGLTLVPLPSSVKRITIFYGTNNPYCKFLGCIGVVLEWSETLTFPSVSICQDGFGESSEKMLHSKRGFDWVVALVIECA
ncbi:uncharacterized protein LAJ45_04329 [Morchella importuna]|uniref:uncharacterized protein n=1 Tax=Morchella importuna TaxID=1174673 RepID=UPI001E8E71A5|nr:uncharacterized protein LAJ45_04329 [Morchella importuna]KAH8151707.1 hypothetical protein LAJ45_04329 [Morchella importuna]